MVVPIVQARIIMVSLAFKKRGSGIARGAIRSRYVSTEQQHGEAKLSVYKISPILS